MTVALLIKNRQGLIDTFRPEQVLPSLTAGAVVGILAVVYGISFATLIFSDELAPFVVSGIGLTLFGAFVLGLAMTLLASFSGLIPIPQDSPAAILGVVAAAIAGSMPASAGAEDIFGTVAAAIVLTTLLSGAFFFCIGWFKLGRWVRFMPYPVVGGFLAGTGWLIVSGAMGLMTDTPLTLAHLPALIQPALFIKWLPGLILAVVLLVILRRYHHFLVMPGLLVAAIVLFYLMLFLSNGSVEMARSQGWLFETVPDRSLWQPQALYSLGQANWMLLFGQAGNVGIIILVSLMATLLNMSGIALAGGKEIDLDRELQVTGLANLLAGLGGSSPGYPALSLSVLGQRLGGNGRITGLVSAGLCGITLFYGASLIALFPKVVLGGTLLFLGLSLLVEWIYEAWFKLSKVEYGLVLVILVIIATFGFLTGVIVGLIVAVGLFVVSYSQVNVVKEARSGGSHYRSNVMRCSQHDEMLQRYGGQLYILKLQGFIFFGTAHSLLDQIQQRLNQPNLPRLQFVLLDFRLVNGLDSSAVLIFTKLKQLAQAHGLVLVFTHLDGTIQQQLAKEVFARQDQALWRIYPDLDHGLEWCETQMIQSMALANHASSAQAVAEVSRLLADNDQVLLPYLEQVEVSAGQTLIQQGEPSKGLYFIETGRVTVWLAGEDGAQLRLRTMTSGAVVGEVSWYLGQPASASVVTDEASTLYYLPAGNLRRMEQEAPGLAINFHTFIACLLCERVAKMNEVVQTLQY
jgi:SulP family sulfate permease